MVQKKWTGLSLILGLLFLSGCYSLFASPKEMVALEREVEAVEEELEDARITAQKRKKTLAAQVEEIRELDRERRLFFDVLKQKTMALLEDMEQVFDDLGRLSLGRRQVSARATESIKTLKGAQLDHEKEWQKRRGVVKGHICTANPKAKGCPQ